MRKKTNSLKTVSRYLRMLPRYSISFLLVSCGALGIAILDYSQLPVTKNLQMQLLDFMSLAVNPVPAPEIPGAEVAQWQEHTKHLTIENEELKRQAKFVASQPEVLLTTRVLSFPTTPFSHTLIINAGSSDGVAKDQVAVTHEGVVGRIIEVGEKSSRVLLITNINSRIPALLDPTNAQAILSGDNTPTMELTHFAQESSQPTATHILTSGKGGIFPPGLALGTIIADNKVSPAVSYKQLNFVQILKLPSHYQDLAAWDS